MAVTHPPSGCAGSTPAPRTMRVWRSRKRARLLPECRGFEALHPYHAAVAQRKSAGSSRRRSRGQHPPVAPTPQQRTCRWPREGRQPRSTRGEETAGGGSLSGRVRGESSQPPVWKVAREVRGAVANRRPGDSPRAFDPLTFRQGKRRSVDCNLSRKQGWRGNARGFDSFAFRACRQSQLETTLESHSRGPGSIPGDGASQSEVM